MERMIPTRPGERRHAVTIKQALGMPPVVTQVAKMWASLTAAKPTANPSGSTPENLRGGGLVRRMGTTVANIRYRAGVQRGMYLFHGERLFLIDDIADAAGNRREMDLVLTELSGYPATYRQGENEYPIRTVINNRMHEVGEFARVGEHRRIAEIPRVELPVRPAPGDQIVIGVNSHTVIGLADGGDDGITIRLGVR